MIRYMIKKRLRSIFTYLILLIPVVFLVLVLPSSVVLPDSLSSQTELFDFYYTYFFNEYLPVVWCFPLLLLYLHDPRPVFLNEMAQTRFPSPFSLWRAQALLSLFDSLLFTLLLFGCLFGFFARSGVLSLLLEHGSLLIQHSLLLFLSIALFCSCCTVICVWLRSPLLGAALPYLVVLAELALLVYGNLPPMLFFRGFLFSSMVTQSFPLSFLLLLGCCAGIYLVVPPLLDGRDCIKKGVA